MKRPSWHEYFMSMAILVSKRATCLRRKVGAVLVKNNQIIASGYNGAPKHVAHCSQTGCMREMLNVPSGEKHELCRGVHAEQNTIIQAALNGTSIKDSVLYCTNFPCSICAKMIINAEIAYVYVLEDYPDKLAKEMFSEAGTEVILIDMDKNLLTKLV
ncbi:MAG: cytidine/deoxycytidylate deaminase family protein [Candidatus Cloacimonetes bacterium]|jgi:dCMP deaminase|nr:cytidine/deoxycytidylate deaminase family protein [Candidatus Cloacimonadota bacterium]